MADECGRGLTAKQEEELVEKISKKVVSHMYEEVGRNVLGKLAWATGIVVIFAMLAIFGKDALLK